LDTIRSSNNPIHRQLVKLSQSRRERLKSGLVLLCGTHLVASAAQAGWALQRLVARADRTQHPEIAYWLAQDLAPVTLLDPALYDAIEQMPSPGGLMAIGVLPDPPAVRGDGLCVLLDGIQDPGNVGSILRTAAAAGVDQVWLGLGCADAWSPKVLRAAMGAHFALSVVERVDAVQALIGFTGQRAITTLADARSLYDCDLRGDLVLALGAEGQGVSPEVERLATLRVCIPMHPGIESLNVGAAAAICLFERRRQLLGQRRASEEH
jgi:RNA methyltransferase, TrmH family